MGTALARVESCQRAQGLRLGKALEACQRSSSVLLAKQIHAVAIEDFLAERIGTRVRTRTAAELVVGAQQDHSVLREQAPLSGRLLHFAGGGGLQLHEEIGGDAVRVVTRRW